MEVDGSGGHHVSWSRMQTDRPNEDYEKGRAARLEGRLHARRPAPHPRPRRVRRRRLAPDPDRLPHLRLATGAERAGRAPGRAEGRGPHRAALDLLRVRGRRPRARRTTPPPGQSGGAGGLHLDGGRRGRRLRAARRGGRGRARQRGSRWAAPARRASAGRATETSVRGFWKAWRVGSWGCERSPGRHRRPVRALCHGHRRRPAGGLAGAVRGGLPLPASPRATMWKPGCRSRWSMPTGAPCSPTGWRRCDGRTSTRRSATATSSAARWWRPARRPRPVPATMSRASCARAMSCCFSAGEYRAAFDEALRIREMTVVYDNARIDTLLALPL